MKTKIIALFMALITTFGFPGETFEITDAHTEGDYIYIEVDEDGELQEYYFKNSTTYTYVMCDVTEYNFDDETGETIITCLMPNGELDDYAVTDAPEEICEVTFRTSNQDDYRMYEVVALR